MPFPLPPPLLIISLPSISECPHLIPAQGITAISLLQAHSPYEQMSLQDLTNHIQSISPLEDLSIDISDEFRSFLVLCFQFDPERRPSAEELLQHPFLAHAPPPQAVAEHVERLKHQEAIRAQAEEEAKRERAPSSVASPAISSKPGHGVTPASQPAQQPPSQQPSTPLARPTTPPPPQGQGQQPLSYAQVVQKPAAAPSSTPSSAASPPAPAAQTSYPPVAATSQPQQPQQPVYATQPTYIQTNPPPSSAPAPVNPALYASAPPGASAQPYAPPAVSNPTPAPSYQSPQPVQSYPQTQPQPQPPQPQPQPQPTYAPSNPSNVVPASPSLVSSVPGVASAPAPSQPSAPISAPAPTPASTPAAAPKPAPAPTQPQPVQPSASTSAPAPSLSSTPVTAQIKDDVYSNVPIECYLGESKHEYVVFIRAIPQTQIRLQLDARALFIAGTLPPLPLPAEEPVTMRDKVGRQFERVVQFPAYINASSFSKSYNKAASTLVVRIRKFAPVDLGSETF